jgi:predicted Zn-dependent protease
VLFRRIGYPDVMIETLSWIQRSSGDQHADGFLSTHPALNDRILARKKNALDASGRAKSQRITEVRMFQGAADQCKRSSASFV